MHSTPQTRLIVNADDFGVTEGVNRAVGELHAAGALTSATLMAQGAAFADAVRIAREQPSLGVGCHVVLVDGMPTAAPERVGSLLAPSGEFSNSIAYFAGAVLSRFTRPEAIEAETAAQIARLQDAGIAVTHVDTHKHTHMLPRVARAVMLGALRCGVGRIRNPFEPAWCARISPAPLRRHLPFRVLHLLRRAFEGEASRLGMATTDGSVGLIATGSLDAAVLQRITGALPGGTFELVCHPGYHDAALDAVRTRLRATRETEREALLQCIPRLAPDRVQRIRYGQL